MTPHAPAPQPRYVHVCAANVGLWGWSTSVSEIWMGADIDQVECSQGERLENRARRFSSPALEHLYLLCNQCKH